MNKLGYIISKRKIKDIMDGVGVVSDVSLADPNKPFLIIGLENARKYSDKFSILDKKLNSNGGFWTFLKTERRDDYENGIEAFYEYLIDNIYKNIKYYYINILSIKFTKIKNLIEILHSTKRKYIYISNDVIYIYIDNYIMGFSLEMIDYCGINKNKILSKLHRLPNSVYKNDNNFINGKLYDKIKNNKYIIPYIMSLYEN